MLPGDEKRERRTQYVWLEEHKIEIWITLIGKQLNFIQSPPGEEDREVRTQYTDFPHIVSLRKKGKKKKRNHDAVSRIRPFDAYTKRLILLTNYVKTALTPKR